MSDFLRIGGAAPKKVAEPGGFSGKDEKKLFFYTHAGVAKTLVTAGDLVPKPAD